MKRMFASLAILACLGFTSSSVVQAPPIWIQGNVYNASTGDPVQEAVIVLEGSDVTSDAALTNAQGQFILSVASLKRPIELAFHHSCYHMVRLELRGRAFDGKRRVDVGLPPDNEQYAPNAPPIAPCPTR